MGNITANFSRYEFACRCGCGMADPHPILVASLQHLVDQVAAEHARRPHFAVTGPGRCPTYNRKVGGASHSKHLQRVDSGYFEAVDGHLFFMTTRATPRRLPLRRFWQLALQEPAFAAGGVGVYFDDTGPRLHLDVRRDGPARWGLLDGDHADIEEVLLAAYEWEKEQS